jgi:hypothetical protein
MNGESIACPYCNTQFPHTAASSGQRLSCPRCGESFPYRPSQSIQSSPDAPATEREDFPTTTVGVNLARPDARRSNRRLAALVLGVMASMALLSLVYALATVESRRKHDPKPLPSPVVQGSPVGTARPTELPALGYLPPGTNLVLAINVAEAERSPAGRAFLDRSYLDDLGFALADIEKVVGLKREQIDHIVLGIKTDELRPVLVLRTRQPYDAAQVRTTLQARGRTLVGKKELYHFTLAKPHLEALLWPADRTTLAVSLGSQDLKDVPDEPARDGAALSAPLREFLKERMPTAPQAWLVGTVENWDNVRPLLAERLSKAELATLTSVRAFGFGLHLDDGVRITAAVQCADDAGAKALEKRWGQTRESNYLRVLGSSEAGKKVAEELAVNLTLEREGVCVVLRTKATAETVRGVSDTLARPK